MESRYNFGMYESLVNHEKRFEIFFFILYYATGHRIWQTMTYSATLNLIDMFLKVKDSNCQYFKNSYLIISRWPFRQRLVVAVRKVVGSTPTTDREVFIEI